MKITKSLIITLASSAVLAGNCFATTYYVAQNGNDKANGTSASTPWKTLNKVSGFSFAPGDVVQFNGGNSFPGTLTVKGGSASAFVTYQSYGTGRAIIDGGNGTAVKITNVSNARVRNLFIRGNIASPLQNSGSGIEVRNDKPNTTISRIYLNNLEVAGFNQAGIQVVSWPSRLPQDHASVISDIRVLSSFVHDNVWYGVKFIGPTTYANSNNTYIRNGEYSIVGALVMGNTISGNKGTPNANGSQVSGSGIMTGQTRDFVVSNNEIYGNGTLNGVTTGGPYGYWAYDSNNGLVQSNHIHHNSAGRSNQDGGCLDFDGAVQNSTMQYNYCHDNMGPTILFAQFPEAGREFSRNIARYNIGMNDGLHGDTGVVNIWYGGSTKHFKDSSIYNNTFIFDKSHVDISNIDPSYHPTGNMNGVLAWGSGQISGTIISNNIFEAKGGASLGWMPTISRPQISLQILYFGNLYNRGGAPFSFSQNGQTFTSLNSWQTSMGQETWAGMLSGTFAPPDLIDPANGSWTNLGAFCPRLTSPALNRGQNLNGLFGSDMGVADIVGTSTPQQLSYDIGACESL